MHYSTAIIISLGLILGGGIAYQLLSPPGASTTDQIVIPPLPPIDDEFTQYTFKEQPYSYQDNPMTHATLHTNQGDITIELYPEDAPLAVENFVTLAHDGYYDDVIFHRVIPGFMIQGGDPTGTGTGGPGYQFADELDPSTPSYQRGYVRGAVAMANAGPNTNGSQFFIMHQDYALPHSYTIFGYVTAGMDVVDAIASTKTNGRDKPLTDMVIESIDLAE